MVHLVLVDAFIKNASEFSCDRDINPVDNRKGNKGYYKVQCHRLFYILVPPS